MSETLTERRKDDRAVMALGVAELAIEHGLTAWHTSGPRMRGVDLAGPHGLKLSVQFRGDSPQARPDVYVLSWHGVEDGARLHPGMFNSVNPYHGHKATDVAYGFAQLMRILRERFTVIADGSAFVVPA